MGLTAKCPPPRRHLGPVTPVPAPTQAQDASVPPPGLLGSAASKTSDQTFTEDFVLFWNYFLNRVLFFIGNRITRFKSKKP